MTKKKGSTEPDGEESPRIIRWRPVPADGDFDMGNAIMERDLAERRARAEGAELFAQSLPPKREPDPIPAIPGPPEAIELFRRIVATRDALVAQIEFWEKQRARDAKREAALPEHLRDSFGDEWNAKEIKRRREALADFDSKVRANSKEGNRDRGFRLAALRELAAMFHQDALRDEAVQLVGLYLKSRDALQKRTAPFLCAQVVTAGDQDRARALLEAGSIDIDELERKSRATRGEGSGKLDKLAERIVDSAVKKGALGKMAKNPPQKRG